MLAEHGALPQLVRHDGWAWHLHATPADAPLAARMAVEAAMAMVDVIRAGELDRLRTCESATATTSWSTCRRTGPGATATPAAGTGPTSRPTGPARARLSHASPPAAQPRVRQPRLIPRERQPNRNRAQASSPFVDFDRASWAELGRSTPLPLTAEELDAGAQPR